MWWQIQTIFSKKRSIGIHAVETFSIVGYDSHERLEQVKDVYVVLQQPSITFHGGLAQSIIINYNITLDFRNGLILLGLWSYTPVIPILSHSAFLLLFFLDLLDHRYLGSICYLGSREFSLNPRWWSLEDGCCHLGTCKLEHSPRWWHPRQPGIRGCQGHPRVRLWVHYSTLRSLGATTYKWHLPAN